MIGSIRLAQSTLVAAGALALLATAAPVGAQQRRAVPRIGVAAQPRAETPPRQVGQPSPFPGTYVPRDPRRQPGDWPDARRRQRHDRGPRVVYVPVPAGYFGYGYGYGYTQGGYYTSPSPGAVYDANGRPLSAAYESAPASSGYGYTPDLSGSPYSVTDEGMMVVDFASEERRAFPSCAAQSDLRDPQGRPRTIFYQQPDYWMVLRPGQRGRVHGAPPAGAKACYAIDSVGRVVLRY